MNCPACRHPLREVDDSCGACGLSLEALASHMGMATVLSTPVADLAGVLSRGEARVIQADALAFERRFPQVGTAVVLVEAPPQIPLTVQAFWWFNRGGLFSAAESGGKNHGVLLFVDTSRRSTAAVLGYGLEPLIPESVVELCLAAASRSVEKGAYAQAVGAFFRELARQFTSLLDELPRIYGHAPDERWLDAALPDSTAQAMPAVDEDLY